MPTGHSQLITDKSEIRLNAFGSSCHVIVDDRGGAGQDYLSIAKREIERLELKFSAFHPDSVVSRINQDAGTGSITPLDPESRSLFQYVDALWRESKHIFDPTTRLLQDCYADDGRLLASQSQLQGMLKLVGWSGLQVTQEGACLKAKGMLIDLNACVRPYVVDCVRKLLIKEGAGNALIEMDRDIGSIGKQPDGANWLIGARVPRVGGVGITRLKLNHRGYAMRGDFERSVMIENERFSRALSPIDGQPIPGLLSVGVIAEDCLTACSAATIAKLKTEQAGMKWLDTLGLQWIAVDRNLQCHGPLAPVKR
jgi:thiamine biosynthesis lipoprotein